MRFRTREDLDSTSPAKHMGHTVARNRETLFIVAMQFRQLVILVFRWRLVFAVFRISYVIFRVNIVSCGTVNIRSV